MASTAEGTAPVAEGAMAGSITSVFSDRELKYLVAALLSQPSGALDIDMARFEALGGFNTRKTAQNTWGKLKKKIVAFGAAAGGDGGDNAVSPQTPSKKRKDSIDGSDGGSAKKKAGKVKVKVEELMVDEKMEI